MQGLVARRDVGTEVAAFRQYEAALALPRDSFSASKSISTLLSPNIGAPELHGFLLHFCALGVGMTENVERWIATAGVKCIEVGFPELGRALVHHASDEHDHHLMLAEDAVRLSARWNETYTVAVDPHRLLGRERTRGIREYVALHEEVCPGSKPYRQLAIEYEIEGLSVRVGPPLLQRCREVLGEELVQDLSFIREHVQVDVGHTLFNARKLSQFLAAHPHLVDEMAETGQRALSAYHRFMTECYEAGLRLAGALPETWAQEASSAVDESP